jgi:uncharacterized membrane protein (Fun14 family)
MVVGAVIGFAVKKVLKLLAILAGVQAGVLAYLENQGVVTVNWEAFQNMAVITVGDGGGMPPILSSIMSSIPVGSGLAVGAAIGFRKG